ncbi:MAG: DsrE family protein [Gemmatimonadota bacterium]|nr:DsrE family protein [Gemmatimonadota bacterium]MDH5196536.1 DsrE family protein [Gemmatimonadota bacterium]
MRTLFIVNDAPYGSERSYNALRLAASLATRESEEVWVFLMGDATSGAKAGQSVPKGYYNFEALLRLIISYGGSIGACGTCLEARGIGDGELGEGIQKYTLQTLTDWVQEVDRVLTF